MTFHEPPLGPGPQSGQPGDGDDDFDPAIAARFSMLDQVAVPQTWPPKPQVDNVRPIWPVWQSVGVAAAAAIVLAVAVTALIPDRNDGGSVVIDAADGPRLSRDEPAASDRPRSGDEDERSAFGAGENEADDTDRSRSTTAPERATPTLTVVTEDERPTPTDDETDSESTRPPETRPIETKPTGPTESRPDPDPDPTVTRPTDTKPVETRPIETKPIPTITPPDVTRPVPTIDPPETRPTLTEPLDTLPPETRPTTTELDEDEGRVIVVRGLVTEVFTDCSARLILNDEGEVERVGPVSCDGGSHIVVDGVRIQTSAGFVPADLYYDKHPRNLLPGQRAVVTAVTVRYGERTAYTLNCDRCGVSIGR